MFFLYGPYNMVTMNSKQPQVHLGLLILIIILIEMVIDSLRLLILITDTIIILTPQVERFMG